LALNSGRHRPKTIFSLGGLVIAALLWPHDFVWKIVFLCGGVAMAYFDKRALFCGTDRTA
jgi:hypothetical protein